MNWRICTYSIAAGVRGASIIVIANDSRESASATRADIICASVIVIALCISGANTAVGNWGMDTGVTRASISRAGIVIVALSSSSTAIGNCSIHAGIIRTGVSRASIIVITLGIGGTAACNSRERAAR